MTRRTSLAATPASLDATATEADPRLALVRLCAIGFLAYCSYAICRTPLLPLLARELGADASMVGFVVGASTLTGILVKLPAGAWSDVLGRRPLLLLLGTIVFLAREVRSSAATEADWTAMRRLTRILFSL